MYYCLYVNDSFGVYGATPVTYIFTLLTFEYRPSFLEIV